MSEISATWTALLDEIKRQNAGGIAVRGSKKYTSVAVRNEVARRFLGDQIGIATEIVHWAPERGSLVVVKAIIRRTADDRVLATGHAEEIRGQGQVNSTSALENAETSAIGRALAALGCSGGEFASANEMDGVERKKDAVSATQPAGVVVHVKEPPHDPETGEVHDDARSAPMPSGTGLSGFMDIIKEQVGPMATPSQIAHAYAAAVIDKVTAYKPNKRGEPWLEQFAQTHEPAIVKLQKGLQVTVREAFARKRAEINDPGFDPRDFEPIGMDEMDDFR